MIRRYLSGLAWLLAVVAVGPASGVARARPEGHGGREGHAAAGFRDRFGCVRPGFRRGYYGYPGWYGYGWGYGWGYDYPYYPYAPGCPIYVDTGYGLPPNAPPPSPAAVQGTVPVAASTPVPTGPVRLTDTDVLLSIRVPPEAVVRINGEQTAQVGPRREFISSGLAPGRSYTFVVTARWTGPDGLLVDLERRIPVQGGERRTVDFLTSPAPPPNELPPLDRAGH
jgi:uncharacterized protein (TIGR03000 family)